MESSLNQGPAGTGADHSIRVSDAERERAIDLLRVHTATGRLTTAELEERIDETYAARSVGELQRVLRELPGVADPARGDPAVAVRGRPGPTGHPLGRGQVLAFLLVNTMLLVIWAATGAGYFWPIWPLLGWGIPLAMSRLSPGARCSASSRSASSSTRASRRPSISS